MSTLVMVGQLLLGLGLLVFIHELGHFLAARAFGVRVEKFFIFFDFNGIKIFSKKIGDTEYGIGWFPLGGYVKMAGMIDESMDLEQMKGEPQDWELRSKPPWQRLIVMLGGIIMNLILGVLIFAFINLYYNQTYIPPASIEDGIYAYPLGEELGFKTGDVILQANGDPIERTQDVVSMKVLFGAVLTVERDGKEVEVDLPDELFQTLKNSKDVFIAFHNYPFTVDSVLPNTRADEMGLLKGDKIAAINNDPVNVFGDLRTLLMKHDSSAVDIMVVRNGDTLTKHIDTLTGGTLGFFPTPMQPYKDLEEPYTVGSAFTFGAKDGWEAIYYNAVGLGKIFTGKVDARESVQSPIGIATIYGKTWQWPRFWYLTGLISFILAFMNLLPIPALDGGHVLFIIVEMIQGKPVSEQFMERAQKVGIIILLAVMVFAIGNDIIKLIFK